MNRAISAAIILSSLSVPALAQTNSITIDRAVLQAKGVAVTVFATVNCTAPDGFPETSLSLSLSQVIPKEKTINRAGQAIGITCSGIPQPVTIKIDPLVNPFRSGVAFYGADIFACIPDFSSCVIIAQASGEIRITQR